MLVSLQINVTVQNEKRKGGLCVSANDEQNIEEKQVQGTMV